MGYRLKKLGLIGFNFMAEFFLIIGGIGIAIKLTEMDKNSIWIFILAILIAVMVKIFIKEDLEPEFFKKDKKEKQKSR
jgi:hypothetical protein